MESLIVLLVLVVLAVPVLLVVALVQLASVRGRVAGLEREVERLRQSGGPARNEATLAELTARENAARAQGERAATPSVAA
ncbi:hypothetical protein, partial [Lysobacter enzymogenes]|uniref:hypothetical protein n=1 Tax=Lysobacter enzymogenes TaxID=69 RepID=UPI0019D1C463